jgi:hypothetical protein
MLRLGYVPGYLAHSTAQPNLKADYSNHTLPRAHLLRMLLSLSSGPGPAELQRLLL